MRFWLLPWHRVIVIPVRFLYGLIFPPKKGARFLSRSKRRWVLNNQNDGLLVDGKNLRMSAKASFEHCAVISPTGRGKTSRFLIPNVLMLDDCSLVVTDPDGEIFNATSGILREKGFDVQVFNLVDPAMSFRFNPVAKADSFLDIDNLAHGIIHSAYPVVSPKDKIWYDEPETILSVLLHCLKNTGQKESMNLHNVLYLLQNFGEDGSRLFDFVKNNAQSDMILNRFKGFLTGNPRMVQTFITMAKSSLKTLNNPDIARLLSQDDLNFNDLRRRKTAVFIVVPPEKIKFYSFITNLFYMQFFQACKKPEYIHSGLPIYVLCDEFGHGHVPNFPEMATTLRKYRVSLSIVIQSIGQLKEQYGDNGASTILEGGMNTKLFYSGTDLDTSKMVESLLGKMKKRARFLVDGEASYQEENLMNADQVRTMGDNQALCFCSNNAPIILNTKPYFRQDRLQKMVDIPPVELSPSLDSGDLRFVDLGRGSDFTPVEKNTSPVPYRPAQTHSSLRTSNPDVFFPHREKIERTEKIFPVQ
jgi:type IV secretion system protein VirD4